MKNYHFTYPDHKKYNAKQVSQYVPTAKNVGSKPRKHTPFDMKSTATTLSSCHKKCAHDKKKVASIVHSPFNKKIKELRQSNFHKMWPWQKKKKK